MMSEIILTAFGAVLFITGLAKFLGVNCWRGDVQSLHEVTYDYCEFDENGHCTTHEDCIHDNREVNFV